MTRSASAPERDGDEPRLVVTADDFGAAAEVDAAVIEACRDGILTSASLMVTGPTARQAVERARGLPRLRVGLHLDLVEGRPASDPADVSALLRPDGRFNPDMVATALKVAFDASARAQAEREIRAQFEAFRATGLDLDHVDAHRHFHVHPALAALIVKVGRPFGLKSIRTLVEPARPLATVEGASVPPQLITGLWARLARDRFRRAGLTVADQTFGLRWSGAMTQARLAGLIDRLPPGLTEIFLHPAAAGGYGGAAPGYRYAEEFAALVSPVTAEAVRRRGVRLGGFSDFRLGALVEEPAPPRGGPLAEDGHVGV